MAIYYLDPHTTTNGTGTWASPFSLSSNTRTGLTSNDELRIKGVALTSLLTATSYTATITSKYQLTITAGGSLGADFAAYNVVYIPIWDAFFKISAVSTNVISVQSSTGFMPILDTSVTSITIRKVDTTTYPVGFTGSAGYIHQTASLSNITISDCWTADGTRVTNGTVKTLINNSYTSSTVTVYLSGTSNTSCTFNLQNTHILNQNSTTYQAPTINIGTTNSTYNINQISATGYSSASWLSGFTGTSYNDTINIALLCGSVSNGTFYGSGTTFNITNMTINEISTFLSGSTNGLPYYKNLTINVTNILYNSVESWGSGLITCVAASGLTVNITGNLDCYSNTNLTCLMMAYGDITLTFGSSFTAYKNKRAATQTNITYRLYGFGTPGPTSINGFVYIPEVPALPTGWTSSYDVYYWSLPINITSGTVLNKIPTVTTVSLPKPNSASSSVWNLRLGGYNALFVHRDGSAPFEVLSQLSGYPNTTYIESLVKVTTDATVYRTAGSSLKAYLASKTAGDWAPSSSVKAYKTIKIPVTSGVSYTISGYIKTDDASYLTGDCRVSLMKGNNEVAGQNMTTSCINAWEQFTLTYTATATEELVFSWGMYYENGAKSYWLDDLTIS